MINDMKNTMGVIKRLFAVWITALLFIYTVSMTLVLAVSAHAELTPLNDTGMEDIWGSSGITFAVKNLQIFYHIDSFRYSNCQNGSYIEFQDFFMGGIGNPAKFNYDFGSVTNSGLIYMDVGEMQVAPVNDWSGATLDPDNYIYRGMLGIDVPVWDQELSYRIDNIQIFDPNYIVPPATTAVPVNLGSFYIGLIDVPRFWYALSPPMGGSGVEFQNNFQMTIDTIEYAWNPHKDDLLVGPLYLGEAFADLTGDDPRFPKTWKPNQATPVDFGEFQIGDLFGDINNGVYSNPAGIDVGECDFDGSGPLPVLGAIQLRLPMEGSIRFESATWYYDRTAPLPANQFVDFGPGAIDGLKVHRLDMFLIP
jgi:hypothetical protein